MKIEDFHPPRSEANKLCEIDALVAEGLSRIRAERLVSQLYGIIDGAWADTLAPLANPDQDPEQALLQSFFIAYIHQWSAERLLIAALTQQRNLTYFSNQDSNYRGA